MKEKKRRLHKWVKGDRPFFVKCARCGAVKAFAPGGFTKAYDPKTHFSKRWCYE